MEQIPDIDPDHVAKRDILRVAGLLTLGVGAVFMIVGIASFFSSFGGFEAPHYFWCCFVGIPLIGIGGMMTSAGFMGAIFRYQAAEIAPAGKDTINYVADGVQPAIRTTARAAAEGIAEGLQAGKVFCAQCGNANDADAKFCKHCGHAMN